MGVTKYITSAYAGTYYHWSSTIFVPTVRKIFPLYINILSTKGQEEKVDQFVLQNHLLLVIIFLLDKYFPFCNVLMPKHNFIDQ